MLLFFNNALIIIIVNTLLTEMATACAALPSGRWELLKEKRLTVLSTDFIDYNKIFISPHSREKSTLNILLWRLQGLLYRMPRKC